MNGKRFGTALGAAALGTVMAFAWASPAEAATVSRSDACNSTVCGSGTFSWASNTSLNTGSMSVVRGCGSGSGGSVIQIQVMEVRNGLQYGAEHANKQGCGKYQRFPKSGSTLAWHSGGGSICWWRVLVAATPNGLQHPVYGNIQYNPNRPAGC